MYSLETPFLYISENPAWLSWYLVISFPIILYLCILLLVKHSKKFSHKDEVKRLHRLNVVSSSVWIALTFTLEFIIGRYPYSG